MGSASTTLKRTDRLIRMAAFLTLNVGNGIPKCLGADRCCRVLSCPPQSQDVSWEPAHRVTAAPLNHLQQSREIDARPCSHDHVDVGLDDPQRHDVDALLRSSLANELIETGLSGRIDHWKAISRGPGEMKVELQGAHGGSFSLQRCVCRAHASAWDTGVGRSHGLNLSIASLTTVRSARGPRSPQTDATCRASTWDQKPLP